MLYNGTSGNDNLYASAAENSVPGGSRLRYGCTKRSSAGMQCRCMS